MPDSPRRKTKRYADPYKTYEVGGGIGWVGFVDWQAGFSNNPHLVICGDERLHAAEGAPAVRNAILRPLRTFAAGGNLFDNQTLLIISAHRRERLVARFRVHGLEEAWRVAPFPQNPKPNPHPAPSASSASIRLRPVW